MQISRLVLRNTWRHPLRSVLTVLGVCIALLAFCMIHTMIDAWYAGVKSSAKNRLVVRNAVSLIFYLPISYRNQIAAVPGVEKIGFANWFGGKFRDESYRFAQFAADQNYFDIYPEFVVSPDQRTAFNQDRRGALLGRAMASKFDLKVGDQMRIVGSIFPGDWDFVIRGIFDGRDENVITNNMLFHWDYLNERNKAEINRQPDHAGFYVVQLAPGANPAEVSRLIDQRFANSYAETLTETETAFQQSFVSLSSTIIMALRIVSIVVIAIMLLVMVNTMLMSARERIREYSILKALGFEKKQLSLLIIGESALLSLSGFLLLCLILLPIFSLPPRAILGDLINFFPVFRLDPLNLLISLGIALLVALSAAFLPLQFVLKQKVTDGLRKVG